MDAQCAPPALGQDLEIAARLRRLDYAKSVFLTGHRKIRLVVASNLQNHAAVRAALIRLAGRMQKARAKAETGRCFGAVADYAAPALQRRDMGGIPLDISEERRIVAGADAGEMSFQGRSQARGGGRQRGLVLRIGEQLEAGSVVERFFSGQRSGFFIGGSQIAGLDLARLDIRLVEWVDADDG